MVDEVERQDLSAIEPRRVTDFVQQLSNWRRDEVMPSWSTRHEFDRAEGRLLALAKRHLESVLAWRPDTSIADDIRGLVALLARLLDAAVVTGDRVSFVLTGAELIQLRSAVPILDNYDLTLQIDAGRPARKQYQKRTR